MIGKLFIVSTPIGNLGDMTLRAIETLARADIIAAEDTRHTAALLNHFEIKGVKRMSYHEHSAPERTAYFVEQLLEGKDIALVSDAGTPLISDPGSPLVEAAVACGVDVVPVPGASAVLAALSVSGLDTSKFVFEGFLPKGRNRKRTLARILEENTVTTVLYESPHQLAETLKEIASIAPNRKLAVCKELTKVHETIYRMVAAEAAEAMQEWVIKGEYVILIEGAKVQDTVQVDDEKLLQMVALLKEKGLRVKDAADAVSQFTGARKNYIYHLASREN